MNPNIDYSRQRSFQLGGWLKIYFISFKKQKLFTNISPQELQELIAERNRWESDTVIREVDEGSP